MAGGVGVGAQMGGMTAEGKREMSKGWQAAVGGKPGGKAMGVRRWG